MPIQLGMASSHAPSLFHSTYKGWERIHERLNSRTPQPAETALEDEAEIARRVPRIKAAFATLKEQLVAYDPETLICVIGDQREWFDASNIPNIAIYAGTEDLWTVHNTGASDEDPPADPNKDPRFKYDVKIDHELSQKLLNGLVAKGFDVAQVKKMNPQSNPLRGVPHGWGNPGPHLKTRDDLKIVLVYVNVDDGPPVQLNGQRCLELGRAIAELCADESKKIAIYGSGGMSHNPGGPRSGWVDEPLDNWFLDQLSSGNADALKAMFSFRSENFISGTGELRCWTVVAGAMDAMKKGHKAVKVDYIPARKVTTGSGWTYWPSLAEKPAHRAETKTAVGTR